MKQGKGTEWSEGMIIKEIWLYLLEHRAGEVGRYWRSNRCQSGRMCLAWLGNLCCASREAEARLISAHGDHECAFPEFAKVCGVNALVFIRGFIGTC